MSKTSSDGKKVLFIEEVQSDWHQKGRDEGYETTLSAEEMARRDAVLSAAVDAYEALGREMLPVAQAAWDRRFSDLPEGEEPVVQRPHEGMIADQIVNRLHYDRAFIRDVELGREAQALLDRSNELALRMNEAQQAASRRIEGSIPNAPFRSTWPALVMKRMIRYAADHGFEQIAWTTGEQQAARYNLSEAVGSITVKQDTTPVAQAMAEPQFMVRTANYRANEAIVNSGMATRADDWLQMSRSQLDQAFGRLVEADAAAEGEAGGATCFDRVNTSADIGAHLPRVLAGGGQADFREAAQPDIAAPISDHRAEDPGSLSATDEQM